MDEVLDKVKKYYGKVLNCTTDLKTSACCTAESLPEYQRRILEEIEIKIVDKFYGCGSPIPSELESRVVLDLGCGTGRDVYLAAKLVGEKGKIYAVDKDEQALNQLVQTIEENNIKNIEVIKKESINPLENNSLDFILCYDVVHYLKDRKTIYHEFYRVLRPKGIFSLYPKHLKNDYPLMELAHMKMEDII